MVNVTINVRMDSKCAECRKGGATDNGLCLTCITKAMGSRPMRSDIGRAVRAHIRKTFAETKSQRPFERLGAAMGPKK